MDAYTMAEMELAVRKYTVPGGSILDVGSRKVSRKNQSYKDFLGGYEYVGLDLAAGDNVDVVLEDPYVYPFPDNSFDAVICGQVVEHCKNPFKLMAECARVLKPGGVFLGSAPFVWKQHRYPVDCWRILPDGWRALFEESELVYMESYFKPNNANNVTCYGYARKQKAPGS